MKNVLFYVLLLASLVFIGAFLLGHLRFAFEIGFWLLLLFLGAGMYYSFTNKDYIRRKSKDPRK